MLQNVKKLERPRLSAEDWENAALDALAELGVNGVSVEALARRLGVTKGSFYWHFQSRDALLRTALERWEQHDMRNVIGPAEALAEPGEALRELFRRTSRDVKSHVIYSALLRSLDHAIVAEVIERVSSRRMDYLARAFRQLGMERSDAAHRARLAYAAYVGFLQLALQLGLPRLNHAEFESYVEHVIKTLIPVADLTTDPSC